MIECKDHIPSNCSTPDKGWTPISTSVNLTVRGQRVEEWSTVNWWLCHAINTLEWLARCVQFPMAEAARPRPIMLALVDRVCKTEKILCKFATAPVAATPHCSFRNRTAMICPPIILTISPWSNNYSARTRLRKLPCSEYFAGPTKVPGGRTLFLFLFYSLGNIT